MFLFIFLCLLIWIYKGKLYHRARIIYMSWNIPSHPGALPIVGHAHQLMGDLADMFAFFKKATKSAQDNGGVVKVWSEVSPIFVVTDPVDAWTVLNNCYDKSFAYNFLKPWIGEGLFTGKYSIWNYHRKLLNPAFNLHVLNTFQHVFDNQGRKLAKLFGEKCGHGPFDASHLISQNTLETICETALGVPAEETIQEYGQWSHQILNLASLRTIRFWYFFDFTYKWTEAKKIQDDVIKKLHNYSTKIIKMRKEQMKNDKIEKKKNDFKSLMELLLDMKTDMIQLSDQEIREEVDTFLGAGYDTSSIAVMTTLIMLGSYQDIQEKVYQELKQLFSNADRPVITKEDLKDMKYLDSVLNETLRVYPVAFMVGRRIRQDLQLRNCILPAKTDCFISAWGIHRDKQNWGPDAEEFNPERWLNPETFPRHPASYLAFSVGRRMCIGKHFALISIKTILAHVILKYRVTADHTKLKFKLDWMLRPIDGHHIALEHR